MSSVHSGTRDETTAEEADRERGEGDGDLSLETVFSLLTRRNNRMLLQSFTERDVREPAPRTSLRTS